MKLSKACVAGSFGLAFAFTFAAQAMAQDSCPAQAHEMRVCGTLTVTDYMGVPGTTPKFWIRDDKGQMISLGNYSDWGSLAAASYQQQNVCLYSDQKVLPGVIDIQEICPN